MESVTWTCTRVSPTGAIRVSFAALVIDHRGAPVGAVLVSAPRFRVSTEQVSLIGDAVPRAAGDVTSRLGGQQPKV
jgi:IclR family transcriptional regulator, acetate operon repressor